MRTGRLRWLVIGLIFCATVINYIDRQTVSVLKTAISSDLGLSNADYAGIQNSFLILYGISQMVSGRLYDVIGTRLGFTFSIIVWSFAAMAHAAASTAGAFRFWRGVLGFGEAATGRARPKRSASGSPSGSARSGWASSIPARPWVAPSRRRSSPGWRPRTAGARHSSSRASSDSRGWRRGSRSTACRSSIRGFRRPSATTSSPAGTRRGPTRGRQCRATPDSAVFFVQNDCRLSDWLTLNLGFRYEYQSALKEATGRLANFLPETGTVIVSGDPGYPETLVERDTNNLGPRVGFAARPFGNSKTVIRGGAGIYYSLETFNPIRQQLAVTFPFLVREQYSRLSSNPALLRFDNPFPDGRGGVQGLTTPFGMEMAYQTPEFYQYNITVERQLGYDLSLEAGYVGSEGRRLGRRYNLNQPIPIGLNPTGTLITVRPFPEFGDIQYQSQTAKSEHNALQLSMRRRTTKDLTALVSYTFSRAYDNASSTNNSTTGTQKFPQDIYNMDAEWALSDFHREHQFTGSFTYELPIGRGRRVLGGAGGVAEALLGGWQVNGIATWLSGRPFTPQYSAADVSQQRPDRVGDPMANIPGGLAFNPDAFASPVATAQEPNLYGNAGRNILIGPEFKNVDLSLSKSFRVANGVRAQLRMEAFNVLNTTNFQVPVFLLDRSDVGTFTSTANEAREWQFALKLLF